MYEQSYKPRYLTRVRNEDSRPLDFLNAMKGKRVLVEIEGDVIGGTLRAFDIHINLVLDQAESEQNNGKFTLLFIRGESVKHISA